MTKFPYSSRLWTYLLNLHAFQIFLAWNLLDLHWENKKEARREPADEKNEPVDEKNEPADEKNWACRWPFCELQTSKTN